MSDISYDTKKYGRIYYGWMIVAATWFTYIALTAVTTYSGSVVTTHLVLDRSWNERIVGLVNSCMYAAIAIFAVPAGMIARKWGCRAAYLIAATMGGSVCMVLCLSDAPQSLYLTAFFLFGICTALGGQVTAPIIISCWFDRRKSLPMAIVMTAGGIGGFLLPPFTEYMYGVFGIKGCWIAMSIFEFAALIPIILVYRNYPEDIGEIKDGRKWVQSHPVQQNKNTVCADRDVLGKPSSLSEAYKSKEFILICIMNTVFKISQTAFIAYALLHMMKHGISASAAVMIISVSNIMSLIGRFFVSFMEKLHIHLKVWGVICFLLLMAGEILFAVSAAFSVLLSASILIGLSTGFLTTLIPLLLPEYCGETYFNEQYGMLNTVSFACLIVSPLLVSASAAIFGGYHIAYLSFAVIAAVSSGLAGVLGGNRQAGKSRALCRG